MHYLLLGPIVTPWPQLLRATLDLALPCCWQSSLVPESSWSICGLFRAERPGEKVAGETCGTYQDSHGCGVSHRGGTWG